MSCFFEKKSFALRFLAGFLCLLLIEIPMAGAAFAQSSAGMDARVEEGISSGDQLNFMSIPLQHPVDPDHYIVGVGDQLVVHFWGQKDENIPLVVGPEGNVFLPNIGTVQASGKTLRELKGGIQWLLQKNYPGLRHGVYLVKPRTFRLHVLGHVANAGPMDANAMTHVSEVIAKAGAKGSVRKVEIWRNDELYTTADLLKYKRFARIEFNPYVLDNDRIVVPYAGRVIYVSGAVRSPGAYELLDDENIYDLLKDICGGTDNSLSDRDPAWIVRRNGDDQLHTIEFDVRALMDNPALAANYPLKDADQIKIPSSNKYQKLVRVEGAVAGRGRVAKGVETSETMGNVTKETSGLYPLVIGERVSDLVEKAGGTFPWADLENTYIERLGQDGSTFRVKVDLYRILVDKDFTKDLEVLPGDKIIVPTLQDKIYVTGEVVAPGPRSFLSNYSAMNYMNMAGGPTRRASLRKAEIVHLDGEREEYDEMKVLKPGDTVHVPEKTFKFWQDYWTVLTGLATVAIAGYAVYAAQQQADNN